LAKEKGRQRVYSLCCRRKEGLRRRIDGFRLAVTASFLVKRTKPENSGDFRVVKPSRYMQKVRKNKTKGGGEE